MLSSVVRRLVLALLFLLAAISSSVCAWKSAALNRKVFLPVIVASCLTSSSGIFFPCLQTQPVLAKEDVSKRAFISAAAQGKAIDVRDKKAMGAQVSALENSAKEEAASMPVPIPGVRLVDLGGNRGARGLASDGVQGGNLADQLKAYGGPGAEVRVDNSFKNPLFQQGQDGIAAQLKLYEKLQGGK